MDINLNEKITDNFKWREMLYCPQWNVHAFPLSQMHKENIIDVCETLENIRDILNSPLKITSGYRPRRYNQLIGGAVESYHMQGLAADFIPTKASVHKAKIALIEFLPDLQCRMEDNGKGGWIHIDLAAPGPGGRFFKP
jgi:hypothetical protein